MPPAAAQPVLPDELMEDIFLRLDGAGDLGRVSAACTSFRRVVSGRQFLRRFRSLHAPPVLGFLKFEGPSGPRPRTLHHAEPPHRSAPAARALAQAADFAFSFLPDPDSWQIRDARDGRFLLSSRTTADFGDLVICDPLHRRYVRIPTIPEDLTAGTSRFGWFPVLAPADDEEEEELSFGVIWMVQRGSQVSAFVFSSATGKWRGVTFHGWRCRAFLFTSCRHYAHGCLYLTYASFDNVLMLDTRRMEFSIVDLPHVSQHRQNAIVEAGEAKLGLLTLRGCFFYLYCGTWRDNGVGTEEWQHEKTIPLPDGLRYAIIGAADGHLLLKGCSGQLDSSGQQMQGQCFTLKLKTMLVERLCVLNKHINDAHLYANVPPLLSLPSI
uniref:F-box domain-containing protein n=1 Tax=Arundo donax TaxID=35708 RepID=A0A0A9GUB7_ARUDO